ncbi:hypothetical protein IQ249_14485 [Lusitaniella coriacea LEGE 07157]|uniref:Uncharacterized protein n=1 Tax=Lusitaniella coriacea LEGE 07157 TaxID=945747 RepID=A0A8J7DXJ7_9CYAN|nr:hypothetical protein [Lusitaniella coriacea]MBE9117106.1 hypothetical protein [Lusitaniella coriacea LEGE 07157]
MLDIIASRLLNFYSLILLISMVVSFFSVAIFLSQEIRNSETNDFSVGNLVVLVFSKAPEGRFDIIALMLSSALLYFKALDLSRNDLSLASFLLYFLGSIFVFIVIGCAAMLGKWMNFENSES